ncbi:hypothetical protein D5086_006384 [Populus alba]|uniref:Uncharacterized protein n=1 Tax=Populus alba TaxID=43335 RepID=A0ACC4CKR0_POPAL
MALSAKTPRFPLHQHLQNLNSHFPGTHNSNKTFTLSFKPQKPHLFSSTLNPPQNSLNTAATTSITPQNPTNSRLLQLCLSGNLEQALKHLASMQEDKIPVEEDCFVALIRLCENKRGYSEGEYVWKAVLSSLVTLLSVRLGNALLSMFVRFGDVGNAWNVFGRMGERDLFSWNVLVGGYAKAGFFDEALCLYHRILWAGIRPDVYTFPSVLRSCAGAMDLVRGREVHAHVVRFDFDMDVDVVNALITMMRELSIDPDLMTMTSVISACELLGDERLGTQLHSYVVRTAYDGNISVYNSLIQMYLSVGHWKEAESVFSGMECRDVVSWTTMISGCVDNLLPDRALETYKTMEITGTMPDEVTIASVLSACASLGQLDMGMKLHELAERTGHILYVVVANSLIDMYSKCKRIEKALEIFHQIPDKDVISWTSVINGLRINNRCFEALIFFRKMILKSKPNSVTLISALSACARVGALMCGKEIHAHALKAGVGFDGFLPNAILDLIHRQVLLGELAAQHIFKEDAESIGWVEVKGKVHAFLSGDNFHPQMQEINVVLEGFYEKMKTFGFNGQECSSMDGIQTSKADIFCGHSERQAIAYSLINSAPGMPIWVTGKEMTRKLNLNELSISSSR